MFANPRKNKDTLSNGRDQLLIDRDGGGGYPLQDRYGI